MNVTKVEVVVHIYTQPEQDQTLQQAALDASLLSTNLEVAEQAQDAVIDVLSQLFATEGLNMQGDYAVSHPSFVVHS